MYTVGSGAGAHSFPGPFKFPWAIGTDHHQTAHLSDVNHSGAWSSRGSLLSEPKQEEPPENYYYDLRLVLFNRTVMQATYVILNVLVATLKTRGEIHFNDSFFNQKYHYLNMQSM